METTKKPCEYCTDLDELEGEYHGEMHEGEDKECGECGAEYFEEYSGIVWAKNEQAILNHPKLKMI